ncbi:MAG: PAS domain S-box protein [Cyclobacteriaceae bacterium]|nr:PAS domain S-box protein [Cyclobacteriaceae bacterium]
MRPKSTDTQQLKTSNKEFEQFHLKIALEAANMGIWEWNLQKGSVNWTANVKQILGLENEFDGNPQAYLDNIVEEDRARVAKTINHAIKNKIDFSVEHRILLQGEEIRWIEGNGKVIYNEDGKAVSLTGTVRDITERKNNEDQLKHRDLLFATLSRVISEFIQHENWEDAIQTVLQLLGEMMKVDRVYIFQNDEEINGQPETSSQRFEWNSSGSKPQLDNPDLQHLPIAFMPGINLMLQNKPFHGIVDEIKDEALKSLLESQAIQSILIFPIYVNQKFWGFIGFDDCQNKRYWSDLEFSVLNSFSSSLAAAIARKVSVQALAKSEQSYRELFDTVSEAIYIHDFNGVMLDVNKRVVELYGYTKEELIGQTPAIFMAEGLNDQTALAEKFQKALSGMPQTFEWWGKKKSGDIFLKEVHTNLGFYYGKKVIIATAWDITERKKIEDEIKESELRFRTLQQASFGGIGLHDQGVIIDCNKGLCNITGYSYEELIGMNGFNLIAPEWQETVKQHVVSDYDKPYDVEGIRKDGSRYFVEIQGKQIPYKGKNIRVTEFRDVTARKLAEEKIREQNIRLTHITEDLTKKNDQLEEFTQIVSHNLRSPAGNIASLLNLYEQSSDTNERDEYFKLLKQTSNTILNSLNELNEVLKIKQNTDIQCQDIDFADVVENVKKMLTGKIMEIGATLEYDFKEASSIYFPAIYLESIILNLLSNSLKYNNPKRSLLIKLKSSMTANAVVLTVTDNGLGINLEKHGHQIFKMRKTFHYHPESRGIGLFLVKNQVEALGGSIAVESEEEKGTTFIINFKKPTNQ